VLTSYDKVRWEVMPSPGTRIKAIVVSIGRQGEKIDVQAPPQVPVVSEQLPMTYELENARFRELIAALHTRYGVEKVLAFRGQYSLPAQISVNGPFPPDPKLTLAGVRPEASRARLSFDVITMDGQRVPYTTTGPKDGRRPAANAPMQQRVEKIVASDDGREFYYLKGNGGTLMWAPEGMTGRQVKVDFPPNLPPLSWGSGLEWDTRRGILAIVSFGGEGYFYRYDTRSHTWLDARSLQNRDLFSLARNATTGQYVAISDRVELVHLNDKGELADVLPLEKLLPDLGSVYDRGNSSLNTLQVAEDGEVTALFHVRNGSVTHIWTYDRQRRTAQLTYKASE
jgi:hypothetical protein